MAQQTTFSEEISNMLSTAHGSSFNACIQCGSCSGTCPVVEFMDQSPRRIMAMLNADLKDEVLDSNTYWFCSSCYHCTVRCPADIDITEVMYALKRYSMGHQTYRRGLVGPKFSKTFTNTVARSGRSYEPLLAPTYMFSFGPKDFFQEVVMATKMILKGRMPILPPRVKRIDNFKSMIRKTTPMGESK